MRCLLFIAALSVYLGCNAQYTWHNFVFAESVDYNNIDPVKVKINSFQGVKIYCSVQSSGENLDFNVTYTWTYEYY